MPCYFNEELVSCGPMLFLGLGLFLIWILFVAISILMMVAGWKINVKANKPGWASLVPVYNLVVILEIVKKPLWWVILSFVPLVNIAVFLMVCYYLAKSFGKGIFFTLGIIFLPYIFLPILAFGKSKYIYSESVNPTDAQ